MYDLICPVCKGPLTLQDRSYRCENRHCFDRAKEGYVNLLPNSGHGKRHGDDRLMVKARAEFLGAGHYDRLSREICDIAAAHTSDAPNVLDAGCGEGKYTGDLYRALYSAGKTPSVLGIDISKDALIYASRRNKEITFAVASSSELPVEDRSCDLLLNIFSPFMEEEFRKVLRPGGLLIRVYPLEDHLWELKEAVYDVPYKNDPLEKEFPGYEVLEEREVRYSIELHSNAEITSLFRMTPYYYKTGRKDQEKLERLETLRTKLEFCIVVYRRSID